MKNNEMVMWTVDNKKKAIIKMMEDEMNKVLQEALGVYGWYNIQERCYTKIGAQYVVRTFRIRVQSILITEEVDQFRVNVWNRDEKNPMNIDRLLIEEFWDATEKEEDIKRKIRCLNERLYRIIDEVEILLETARRTAEMEEEEAQAQETETQEEDAQNEDKTEETASEAPDTTVSEPQTQEEYVQPAWKRILAEIDKRREAEKVCVDIS